jgi:hypothetical protein
MGYIIYWDTFSAWRQKIFLVYDCGPEELLHYLKVWAIEKGIWNGRRGIQITATYRPTAEEEDFLIEFKINGEHKHRIVLWSEFRSQV